MKKNFLLLLVLLPLLHCSQKNSGILTGPKYKLTPFSKSTAFRDATIETFTFKDGKMNYAISGTDYKLGENTPDAALKMCANSAQGQHIHVIVDNKPYDAKYEPSFDYTIADGSHYMMTFLSRSYHESLKTPAAHKAIKIDVKKNSIQTETPVNEPMLFYSRPKGNYIGEVETKKVMLDFYPVNADLGKNKYTIHAEINGEVFNIDTWQPYYIEGLPMGDSKIKLTLLDNTGKAVDAPYNPVERTFTLKADPAEK